MLDNEEEQFDILQLVSSIKPRKDVEENFIKILKQYKEKKNNLNLLQKIFYLKLFIQGFEKEFLLGDQILELIDEIFDKKILQYKQKDQLKFFIHFILEICSQKFVFTELDCDFKNVILYIKIQYFESQNEKNLDLLNQPDFIGNFFSIFSFLIGYEQSKQNIKELFQYIFTQIKVSQYLKNWNRQISNDQIRNNQYTGLINLGCTCYINSTIQQLFMIKQFRKFLKLLRIKDSMDLLQNLEVLLNSWKSTNQEFINPKKFIDSIKMFGNESINYSEQMDVDEFIISFFDQIENNLQDKYLVNVFKNFFYGQFKQEVKTQECLHSSLKYEQFVTLTLFIKNQPTLKDSLNHLTAWDNLGGENSYKCNTCEQKSSALKRLTFKVIPNFLFCVLKRFEYDFVKNQKLKIGDVVKFPFDLNLNEYYFEDDKKELEQKGYFKFNLKGIIVHSGDANRGHYVSIIRNKNDQWYLFNDKKVYQVDRNYIEKIAFGQKFEDNLSNSAYVLLYERQQYFNFDKELIQDLFDINQTQFFHDQQQVSLQMKLISIFNKNFSHHFFQQIIQQNNNDVFQIVCTYFFKIVVRNNNIDEIFQFYQSILNKLQSNQKNCIYFVEQFLNKNVIEEFLIFSPCEEVKGFITDLLIESINQLVKNQQNKELIFKFVHLIFYVMSKIEKEYNNDLIFLLLILENLINKKQYASILYMFKIDRILIDLLMNKKIFYKEISEKESNFILKNDKKSKKQKFNYEIDQIILRILFTLVIKLKLQNKKIFQREDFFDSIINYIMNNHTNKKLSEFFMLCTQQNFQLIENQLEEMPINVFNFKKIFYILLEISYLNNQRIFELIISILFRSINQYKSIDYFYFDYLVKFLSELCIQNQQFLDYIHSGNDQKQFIEELIKLNSNTKNLESLQQQNIEVRHPVFYPENQFQYVSGNSLSFKEYLTKKYVLRKRYLNAIFQNSLQDLLSNTIYFYFKDVKKNGIKNQEYRDVKYQNVHIQ